MQKTLHEMQCTGCCKNYKCTRYEYCVDVITNVTITVLTGRPSEVQSFHLRLWHQLDSEHH